MNNIKPIISVDFDGVIHGYQSWSHGPRTISDPPVSHAIEWLTAMVKNGDYAIVIFSSRNKFLFARTAMKKWLRKYGMEKDILKKIKFPRTKPNAKIQIDDRVIRFEGEFPSISIIDNFQPWNR